MIDYRENNMSKRGIKIAFIDEDEAFENADYYVRRALSGYTSTPLGD